MSNNQVVQNVERVEQDIVDGLAKLGVATVHEAQGTPRSASGLYATHPARRGGCRIGYHDFGCGG